jgi:hypothetical protein
VEIDAEGIAEEDLNYGTGFAVAERAENHGILAIVPVVRVGIVDGEIRASHVERSGDDFAIARGSLVVRRFGLEARRAS